MATQKKIMIATPMYGGQLTSDHYTSMMSLQRDVMASGKYGLTVDVIANESLITRARNTLVENFLATDADFLIFIDADIGFLPEQVFRCIESGFDVCGVSYPLKGYSIDKMGAAILEDIKTQSINVKTLLSRSLPSSTNLLFSNQEGQTVVHLNIKDGFLEVSKLGTGLMCISRRAIQKMIEEYPETYTNDVSGYSNAQKYHLLFETMIEPESNRYLSEDYAFCYKWRKLGGQIWVLLDSEISHTGYHRFTANFFANLAPEIRNEIESLLKPKEPVYTVVKKKGKGKAKLVE